MALTLVVVRRMHACRLEVTGGWMHGVACCRGGYRRMDAWMVEWVGGVARGCAACTDECFRTTRSLPYASPSGFVFPKHTLVRAVGGGCVSSVFTVVRSGPEGGGAALSIGGPTHPFRRMFIETVSDSVVVEEKEVMSKCEKERCSVRRGRVKSADGGEGLCDKGAGSDLRMHRWFGRL